MPFPTPTPIFAIFCTIYLWENVCPWDDSGLSLLPQHWGRFHCWWLRAGAGRPGSVPPPLLDSLWFFQTKSLILLCCWEKPQRRQIQPVENTSFFYFRIEENMSFTLICNFTTDVANPSLLHTKLNQLQCCFFCFHFFFTATKFGLALSHQTCWKSAILPEVGPKHSFLHV